MRKLSFLFLIALFTFLIACSSSTGKPDDQKISDNIQRKVEALPQAERPQQLKVEANQGKVTLKGRADSQAARQQIEAIAMKEPGVSSVDDQISVRTEQQTSAAPAPPLTQAAERAPVAPPPPPPKPVVIPSGTVITIRTDQAIDSKTSQVGTAFTGSVATPVSIDGKIVIPAGAPVTGTVRDAKKAGRFKGGASLVLGIDSVTIKDHQYNVETELFDQKSTGKGKRTAGMIGGGAGVGAAIGGIAGGGKGAAIGALVGAGAGTAGAATGNRDITLPAESALSFRLVQPLTLSPQSAN